MAKAPVIGTCRLCKTTNVELKDSHVFPAFAYKTIRKASEGDPDATNTNPFRMSPDGTVIQISDQIREHMLCATCEQQFSTREKWFKEATELSGWSTPLAQALDPLRIFINAEMTLARAGQLDVESLAYIALSIFWRAHECTTDPTVRDFRLEESMAEATRLYLHGGTAPATTIALQAFLAEDMYVKRPGLAQSFQTPVTVDRVHWFLFSAMVFELSTGPCDRHLCLLHSQEPMLGIISSDVIAAPHRERARTAQVKGKSARKYLNARKERKRRSGPPK